MLYFIYQYLQGIAHEVFTDLNMFGHTLKFLVDSSADISEGVHAFELPTPVKAGISLVFVLALIDKLRGHV